MTGMIFIPIIVIVGFIVYQYVLLPKMNAKHEDKQARLVDEFAKKIAGKEAETKQEYIRTNPHIKPIVFQINDSDIIGIVSCQEKRDTGDLLRQNAVNLAGKAVGKLTGVRVREVDNTEDYYLVLTDKNIHYVHFNDNARCKEHLVFSRNEISRPESGEVSAGDALKNNAYQGETKRVSFDYDGKTYKFFVYDQFYAFPNAENDTWEDLAGVNYLFATPFNKFVEKIAR